ncbi:MAG: hypothetical protein NVS3B3_06010 [Aquirhabdus sp.]
MLSAKDFLKEKGDEIRKIAYDYDYDYANAYAYDYAYAYAYDYANAYAYDYAYDYASDYAYDYAYANAKILRSPIVDVALETLRMAIEVKK